MVALSRMLRSRRRVLEHALLAAHPEGQLEAGGRVAQANNQLGGVQLGHLGVGDVEGYGAGRIVLHAAGHVVGCLKIDP
jgi:hypothetical protein